MQIGLIAGIAAGCAVAVGLVVSVILVRHWQRQRSNANKDIEKGQAAKKSMKQSQDVTEEATNNVQGLGAETTVTTVATCIAKPPDPSDEPMERPYSKPVRLEIPETASSREMQMMLDTPYEGPLSYSERQRVIKKVAACLDSPLAASECTGSGEEGNGDVEVDAFAAQLARELQKRRVQLDNRNYNRRHSRRSPRSTPRRHAGHRMQPERRVVSAVRHHEGRRRASSGHHDLRSSARHPEDARLAYDNRLEEDADGLTTGPGRAALMRTVSLLEQLQITNTFQTDDQEVIPARNGNRPSRGSRHSGRDRTLDSHPSRRHQQYQNRLSGRSQERLRISRR